MMTPEEQSQSARNILAALRNEPGDAVERPVAPNLNGLNEAARAKAVAAFETEEERYTAFLLGKKSSELSSEEMTYLSAGIAAWVRKERR